MSGLRRLTQRQRRTKKPAATELQAFLMVQCSRTPLSGELSELLVIFRRTAGQTADHSLLRLPGCTDAIGRPRRRRASTSAWVWQRAISPPRSSKQVKKVTAEDQLCSLYCHGGDKAQQSAAPFSDSEFRPNALKKTIQTLAHGRRGQHHRSATGLLETLPLLLTFVLIDQLQLVQHQ